MKRIKKFLDNQDKWDIYNGFFLDNNIDRIRKFMVREHLFKYTIDKPGDIVELGVFKGIGIAQYLKLKEIFIPSSKKKVIGFDLFSKSSIYASKLEEKDTKLSDYYKECKTSMNEGINKEDIEEFLSKISPRKNYQLIEGDISKTIPLFLKDKPGFRISYLYLDLDIEKPTEIALEHLYDRVVRGGVIVFDEYACSEWSESNAVDKFLQNNPELELKTLPWAETPTAYIIKT